ncbi:MULTISPECIES: EAL domain-containing protein [unclassified Modicisalibacter]|uniref:putative bifunctional diguanylate cyclase/phosphodiesterase n=1 Tax=unclassified Modicisalibacter TaxID=2679913 RepID=UPI001CCE65E6|nr:MULTISPECIES: EAL domain-containing protein [unclassified Modicisalibacter]MBZ9559955.1 EAL domain-containing protein [Modicisalibacter sp. R2A 31.J]MBZ9575863.1 EAL domain-containing protein [Modicisalibacter sp. MOD 31.J]
MPDKDTLCTSHILVVDDNPANIALLEDLLDDAGFTHVTSLADPRRVLAYCRETQPDLLLLDVRMPHIDGLTLLADLQRAWKDEGPPVIVLTAQTDRDTRSQALELGARDFLTKPFDHQETLQRVSNALQAGRLYRQRLDQTSQLEELIAQRTAELERLALSEPITGLPNRTAMIQWLERRLVDGASPYLLFIALDGLDDIARLHGYPAADALLTHACRLLEDAIHTGDRLGCWGGAELLVVSHDALDDATLIEHAQRFRDLLARDHRIGDLLMSLSARIGISRAGVDAEAADQLIRQATLALPTLGERPVGVYSAELECAHQQRARMQQLLREAIDRDEFQLVFQPKIELATGRVSGAEALLRWHNAELGHVSPGDFIPLAEASGDILAIGDWVAGEAIRQVRDWRDRNRVEADFSIAINVATRQLMTGDFSQRLLARLDDAGLPAHAIQVEVTESGLMEDVSLARETLRLLADQGLKIAIDDFGTGYSSLAYLKTLPVTTLKIDRTFINDMLTSSHDRNLAITVITLAHSFGCDVVAEGIEQPQQAELLASLGCESAQGYWFSPPLPAARFLDWKAGYDDRCRAFRGPDLVSGA